MNLSPLQLLFAALTLASLALGAWLLSEGAFGLLFAVYLPYCVSFVIGAHYLREFIDDNR